MTLASLDAYERTIIAAILAKAAQNGWAVSVFDGEEWTVKTSTDTAAIAAAIGTTEETILLFRKVNAATAPKKWPRMGSMIFTHGNGEDVIHDHTDNANMQALADYAASTEAMDAAAVALMATRPDLRALSLDEWLIQHHDALTEEERRTAEAILELHNASNTDARIKLTAGWGYGGQTV